MMDIGVLIPTIPFTMTAVFNAQVCIKLYSFRTYYMFYFIGLINDDIDDDVDCAILIQSRQGFSAWYGWQNHCNGYDTESYVSDCNV